MFEIWSKIVWVCLGWFWITILKSYFSLNKGIYILYLPFRILYLPNFKYPQTTIFKLYVSLPQHSTPHSLTPSLCPTYTMIPLLRLSTPQENLSYKHNDSLSPSTFSPNFYEAFVLWTILSERGIVGTVFKTCILEAFKSVTEKSLRNTNWVLE